MIKAHALCRSYKNQGITWHHYEPLDMDLTDSYQTIEQEFLFFGPKKAAEWKL